MWNECLSSGGGGLIGGLLGTSFVSSNGSKLEVIKCYVVSTIVGLAVRKTDVSALGQ